MVLAREIEHPPVALVQPRWSQKVLSDRLVVADTVGAGHIKVECGGIIQCRLRCSSGAGVLVISYAASLNEVDIGGRLELR